MNDPVVLLESVRFQYPESDWSLEIDRFIIKESEVVGIIGPNGSGKSTLLRIAAGILPLSEGRVCLRGVDIAERDRRTVARHLGFLPQDLGSAYDLTVEEVVRLGRYPYLTGVGNLKESDLSAVERSMELTEIHGFRNRRLSRLSGGEKKRAFLASVLAQEPEVLLLDEPTGALDIHRQVQFFRLLRGLAAQGIGICVVTHDLNLASLFSDRILFLEQGRCEVSGAPAHVLRSPVLDGIYGDEVLSLDHPESGRPAFLPRMKGKEGDSGE